MARRGSKPHRAGLSVPVWHPQRFRLYALTDQGAARVLDLTDFGVGGRDRSWNAHAKNFIAANRTQLTAVAVEPELVPGEDSINLMLRPGGVVGAVPLCAPHSRKVVGGVVVQPRFGWDGIGPLLEKTGWTAQPNILEMPLVPGSAREVPPWVLAGPVLRRLGALLKELRRGFRLVDAVRETPRGQILWQSYITTQITRGAPHQIPCRFPDLGRDRVLRSFLRWGIEVVQHSLEPYSSSDAVARHLSMRAQELLFDLRDTPARPPDRFALKLLLRGTGLPSDTLSSGIEALGWVVDERGLAGRSESDGLAWALPMHELFERWVEHIVETWARDFGASVRTGHAYETAVSIQWNSPSQGSLKSLIPDLVVRRGNQIFVIDAKYKGHFQELDDTRWIELADKMREEHRHDIHQVLAYAALFDAAVITSVLVYPVHLNTWRRLAVAGRSVNTASLAAGGRTVTLALVGLPMQAPEPQDITSIVRCWDRLREV